MFDTNKECMGVKHDVLNNVLVFGRNSNLQVHVEKGIVSYTSTDTILNSANNSSDVIYDN